MDSNATQVAAPTAANLYSTALSTTALGSAVELDSVTENHDYKPFAFSCSIAWRALFGATAASVEGGNAPGANSPAFEANRVYVIPVRRGARFFNALSASGTPTLNVWPADGDTAPPVTP